MSVSFSKLKSVMGDQETTRQDLLSRIAKSPSFGGRKLKKEGEKMKKEKKDGDRDDKEDDEER